MRLKKLVERLKSIRWSYMIRRCNILHPLESQNRLSVEREAFALALSATKGHSFENLGVARRNLWIHPTECTNVLQQEPMAAIIDAHHVEWSPASQLNRHHADNRQISIRASRIENKASKSEVVRTALCSVYMSLGSHCFQLAEYCFWKRSQLGAG